MSRAQNFVGAFGNGSRMKFIANHLVTIHNLASAEALVVGEMAGLDPALVFDVIVDSAGSSRMFQIRGPMMVRGQYDEPTATMTTWFEGPRHHRQICSPPGYQFVLKARYGMLPSPWQITFRRTGLLLPSEAQTLHEHTSHSSLRERGRQERGELRAADPISFLLRSSSVYPDRLARMSSLMTVRGATDRMLEGWAPRPGRRRTQGRVP